MDIDARIERLTQNVQQMYVEHLARLPETERLMREAEDTLDRLEAMQDKLDKRKKNLGE